MADNSASAKFTPGGVPPGSRRRVQASTMLLAEWSMMQPFLFAPYYNLRLGPTPLRVYAAVLDAATEAMLRRSNRYADLVGVTDREIWVVESKVVAEPGAISQVLHYRDLIGTTPTLKPHMSKTIQPILLWAVDDPVIHATAVRQGIRVVVYTPAWVQQYLNEKVFRGVRPIQR